MRTIMRMGMTVLALVLVLAPRSWADSGTWTVDGNSNWNVNANWTGASYPDGAGQTAAITNNFTTNVTITLNVPVTLGTLLMQDPGSSYFNVTLTNATAADKITLDNGASPAVVSCPFGLSSDLAGRWLYPDLILKSDLNVAAKAYGGFYLYGSISEQGGVRNVTLDGTWNNGNGPRLYGTNNSYSGKTTVKRYPNYFGTIGNVGGGNSSLGAPTTVANGTIDIGDGATVVAFVSTATTAMRTDRILNFVGTTGGITLSSSGGALLTYTSPFQFSGTGAKTLTLGDTVAVLGNMDKSDLTVAGSSGGSTMGNIYLLGVNTFTNQITLNRMQLTVNSIANVNVPGIPTAAGAPETVANGTIVLGGTVIGTGFRYIGFGDSTDRIIDLKNTTGGSSLNASGYGKLTLTSAISASGNSAKTLTLAGTGAGELQGAIPDAADASPISLSKTGAGTWTLKGDNSSGFTGTITINGAGGTLEVGHDNALHNGALTLTAGNLAAAGAARTINNPITAISSGFGFTGSENLTLTATIPATAGARTFYNTLASGKTLTLGAMNLTPDTNTWTTTFEGGGDTVISGAVANGGAGSGALAMSGTGTLTLKGANTYTNGTALNAGGTLVLDYASQDNSKLDDNTPLTLGGTSMGGTLILTNSAGNHIEQVGSTALNAGGIRVTRPSGGATLRMQALTRAAGGTIDFAAGSIADISLTNVNGILGGYATVCGTDWAVGGAGNTPVTAYSGYTTPLPAAGPGNSANNYSHNVAGQAQAAVAANTLKIANGQNNDTLTLNGNLTNTSSSATSLGGILYVGGYDNTYTIGGTGRILPSTAAQELIFNVYTGTLTVTAPIHASAAAAGSLTKTGAGKLVVNNANAFTGATRVNQGTLNLKDSSALGTSSSVSVQRGAAVELDGGGVNLARALTIHGAGPDNSGALKNASGANTWSGAITVGTGGARIENADVGNALTLSGGIVTAARKDLTLGGAGNISVTSGVISGGGAVNKDGGGTLTLASANTYTGPTTVNAGTLKVTGSIAVGSLVTVNSNAVLSGSGRCYGEVRVRNGGTIKPEGGNLTVSNLVLYAGSTVYREAGTTNRVVVSQVGDLVFQQGLTIIGGGVYLDGRMPAGTHTVIDYSGDLNGSVTNLAVLNPEPGARYEFVDTGTAVAVKVERPLGMMLMVK